VPGAVAGEHAEEDVRADSFLEAVVNGADLKLRALESTKAALDLGQQLVGAHHVGGWELVLPNARPQDVEAVERRVGLDLR
jgi:hypothetical protein